MQKLYTLLKDWSYRATVNQIKLEQYTQQILPFDYVLAYNKAIFNLIIPPIEAIFVPDRYI